MLNWQWTQLRVCYCQGLNSRPRTWCSVPMFRAKYDTTQLSRYTTLHWSFLSFLSLSNSSFLFEPRFETLYWRQREKICIYVKKFQIVHLKGIFSEFYIVWSCCKKGNACICMRHISKCKLQWSNNYTVIATSPWTILSYVSNVIIPIASTQAVHAKQPILSDTKSNVPMSKTNFSIDFTPLCWNKAIWLDGSSRVTAFNQSDCLFKHR